MDEAKIAADADEWIVMAYDAPFFGLSPIYLGGVRSQYDATGPERMGMKKIVDAMMYVRDGGGDPVARFHVRDGRRGQELLHFGFVRDAQLVEEVENRHVPDPALPRAEAADRRVGKRPQQEDQ